MAHNWIKELTKEEIEILDKEKKGLLEENRKNRIAEKEYYDEISSYKKEEIQNYFNDFIAEEDREWIIENVEDLHHHAFNTDYYIIGTFKATEWLGNQVFEIINFIKDYEQNNFGEVTTDLSKPEAIVNMYVYIIGEEIVSEYIQHDPILRAI
tara:strand:- start:536 stop:994 length:459 start_codon:yes stop_codon:yes gene_type:complete